MAAMRQRGKLHFCEVLRKEAGDVLDPCVTRWYRYARLFPVRYVQIDVNRAVVNRLQRGLEGSSHVGVAAALASRPSPQAAAIAIGGGWEGAHLGRRLKNCW